MGRVRVDRCLLLFVVATLVGAFSPRALLAFSPSPPPIQGESHDLAGSWEGTLEITGFKLRLVFHLEKTPEGHYTGTVDSPDQGSTGNPLEKATLDKRAVVMSLPKLAAEFHGNLDSKGKILTGTWSQSNYKVPLELRRLEEGQVAETGPSTRPQEPTDTLPYREEKVTFKNEEAGIVLAGTLTEPEGEGLFPAVVLISGSGPQDRDESLLGHRPFYVLADHLTRQGIAVLRFDDRGVGESEGHFSTATSEDFATDASAAIDFLKSRNEIHPDQLGLVGHSEGGMIAPMVAVTRGDLSFIVLLAGPGLTGEQILYSQAALIARANGAPEEAIAKNKDQQKAIFELLKSPDPMGEVVKKIRSYLEAKLVDAPEAEQAQGKVAIEAQIAQVATPWFRYFLTFDPAPVLAKVRCPVLALIGEKDLQVPCKENLDAIAAALRKGGNPDVTVKALPKLNHLFQTCETGSPTEYSEIEETFAPVAMELISSWILKRNPRDR